MFTMLMKFDLFWAFELTSVLIIKLYVQGRDMETLY